MKQVHLERNGSHQVAWVDNHPKLKKGNHLSFKEATKEFWNILDVYQFEVEKQDIPHAWKVGGL